MWPSVRLDRWNRKHPGFRLDRRTFPIRKVRFPTGRAPRDAARKRPPHFRIAVRALRPNSAVILTNYGSALAATGHYADALVQIRRALALNPDYAPALEDLRRLEQIGK